MKKSYDKFIEKAATHIEKVELIRDLKVDMAKLRKELSVRHMRVQKLELCVKEQDAEIRRLRGVVNKLCVYEDLAELIKRIAKED